MEESELPDFKTWATARKQAAQDSLSKTPPAQKQPYISQKAWDHLEEQDEALKNGNTPPYGSLNDKVKKQVHEDKMEYKLDQLKEADEKIYKWDGIKRMKSEFAPRFCRFKDKDGKHIPADQDAEKAA